MKKEYISKLVKQMSQIGMDAVLIAPGEELNFLFGINPMLCERFQGMFVKADGTMFYICNLLYLEQLRKELPSDIAIYSWFDGDVMTEIVDKVLQEQKLCGKTIGVNATVQAFNILEIYDKCDVHFRNAKYLFEEIRMIKTPEEIENLRKSSKIVDQVFLEVLEMIKPGVTEAELQEFLLQRMSELGGESPECIVGVGANTSYPHYNDNKGIIGQHDVVLMDYGCTFHGMYSDMTRTVFVGEPDEKQKEAYELVKRSNEEAELLVEEGAYIPDIDKKSRDVLDEKGYAKTLINRLGHGIGYTIHEAPDIKQSNKRRLERGMAFSIEPGIYLGGQFGIRIEDVVIVNEMGNREVLNHSTKEMIIIK